MPVKWARSTHWKKHSGVFFVLCWKDSSHFCNMQKWLPVSCKNDPCRAENTLINENTSGSFRIGIMRIRKTQLLSASCRRKLLRYVFCIVLFFRQGVLLPPLHHVKSIYMTDMSHKTTPYDIYIYIYIYAENTLGVFCIVVFFSTGSASSALHHVKST